MAQPEVPVFGDPIPAEQLKSARGERGFFAKQGLVNAIRENAGQVFPVLRDDRGVIPTDNSEEARKRRQRASIAIRRYFPKDAWPSGFKFTARAGEHSSGIVLYVGYEAES